MKRVYEKPSREDGLRILVDRLWPRGLTKAKARVEEWRKEIALSHRLRTWFGHDPSRWAEFRRRYASELRKAGKDADLQELAIRARSEDITLVFGAKDEVHNQAVALRDLILQRGSATQGRGPSSPHPRSFERT